MNEKIAFSELVEKIAVETGESKQLIHDLLLETANITKEGLSNDGFVNIPGIGRFRLNWQETRTGRNPLTGEEIEIPAHSTVKYKGEADLRKYINRKYAHLKPEILEDEKAQDDQTEIMEEAPAMPAEPEIQKEETSAPKEATDFFSRLEETPQPVSADEAPASGKDKGGFIYWWLLLALLIIVLLIIFWPFSGSEIKEETAAQEEAPAVVQTEETAKPEEKPAAPAEEKPAAKETPPGIPGGSHTVKAGDNLWLVSQDFYGKGILWPNIYGSNSAEIKNPDLLLLGGVIDLPSLQGRLGSLTQQDKEEIAEGFLKAYLNYKERGKPKALYYLWVVKKWNMDTVIEKYKDKIDEKDLARVGGIDGHPRID